MISAPKGLLRLAALKLLSTSSLSGSGLAAEVGRISGGEWRPGPGSVYLILSELLRKGLITELPKREGNERRYIISNKGKTELTRMSQKAEPDVKRQLRLLAIFSTLAGEEAIGRKVSELEHELRSTRS